MSLYFQAEHPHIAEEVMKSIKRQAWYLTQELAILSLLERSIRDVEEFANYARDGDKLGKIVTIADSHRIKCPGFKKALMI